MPWHCFRRDQKYKSPGKGSARQAFAPHEVCRHPTAPWVWGDKPGRCWTNSLLGEGRRNREESDFCPRPAPLWCHLAHVTNCSQGPQPRRDPTVREFSTGSKEGIPEAPQHPPAITSGIPLPLPCQHPPGHPSGPSVLQGHAARTKTMRLCEPFSPGRDSVRQSPGALSPALPVPSVASRCQSEGGDGRDGQGAGTDGRGPGRHGQVGEEAGTNNWWAGQQRTRKNHGSAGKKQL